MCHTSSCMSRVNTLIRLAYGATNIPPSLYYIKRPILCFQTLTHSILSPWAISYFQFDSTNMDHSENIPSCDRKPPRLTRDQEHVIMVSALRQVISNVRGDTSSSNLVACEALHQSLDAGPCPLCSITGCLGCAFPLHKEIEKEKKHKGVRQKPSGKLYIYSNK